MKSQVMALESHRAMFEAFGRNKYLATGVIQWMLVNAWPSHMWHLIDFYLQVGGSGFGAKTAHAPLHLQYSYVSPSPVFCLMRMELQEMHLMRSGGDGTRTTVRSGSLSPDMHHIQT